MNKYGKRYSDEQRKLAIELYKKGNGFLKVSRVIGCYPSTVKKWVEKEGIKPHAKNKYPDDLKRNAVQYYKDHDYSITDAAYIFGISKSTLEKWIYESGAGKGKFQYDHKAIIEDLKTMKQIDVARKHGCSESLVSQIKNGKL